MCGTPITIADFIAELFGMPRRRKRKSRSRFHKHKCENCGYVWKHDRNDLADFDKAHSCPKCSEKQCEIYDGSERAKELNRG